MLSKPGSDYTRRINVLSDACPEYEGDSDLLGVYLRYRIHKLARELDEEICSSLGIGILIPVNPKDEGGEFMPEGIDVVMFNENTGDAWVDYRYSSQPKNYPGGAPTHWIPFT